MNACKKILRKTIFCKNFFIRLCVIGKFYVILHSGLI